MLDFGLAVIDQVAYCNCPLCDHLMFHYMEYNLVLKWLQMSLPIQLYENALSENQKLKSKLQDAQVELADVKSKLDKLAQVRKLWVQGALTMLWMLSKPKMLWGVRSWKYLRKTTKCQVNEHLNTKCGSEPITLKMMHFRQKKSQVHTLGVLLVVTKRQVILGWWWVAQWMCWVEGIFYARISRIK